MSEEQEEYVVSGRPTKMPFECEVCGGKHPTLQQASDCEQACKEHCRKRRLAQDETAIKDSAEYHAALVRIIKVVQDAEGVQLLKRLGHRADAQMLLYQKIKGILRTVPEGEAQRLLARDANEELNRIHNTDW